MKSKISKILITVGLLICVGSLSIKGYSKYLENKSTKSFEEKIDKNAKESKEDDFTNVKAGDGNFSLAGHSSYRYNEVFNELHKINLDDEIIIKTLNNEFTYVVKDIFEVNPEDTFVLDQDNEIKELTIVTCTNKGKDRLIVKAEIVEEKNNK